MKTAKIKTVKLENNREVYYFLSDNICNLTFSATLMEKGIAKCTKTIENMRFEKNKEVIKRIDDMLTTAEKIKADDEYAKEYSKKLFSEELKK